MEKEMTTPLGGRWFLWGLFAPWNEKRISPLCGSKREFYSRFGSHGQQLLLTVGFSSRTAHDYRKRRVHRGYPSHGYQGRSPCLDMDGLAEGRRACFVHSLTQGGMGVNGGLNFFVGGF